MSENYIKKGKAFKFGDNISTDHIAPGRLFHLRNDLEEFSKHVLEDADPEFAKNLKKGDFVVAGNNFGLGSSREHAPQIIKIAGVGAVIAKSFARIFYRNAINIGLPVLVSKDFYDVADNGQEAELDLAEGTIVYEGTTYTCTKLPPYMQNILNQGGLIASLNQED